MLLHPFCAEQSNSRRSDRPLIIRVRLYVLLSSGFGQAHRPERVKGIPPSFLFFIATMAQAVGSDTEGTKMREGE
jgi:hypothetical protein